MPHNLFCKKELARNEPSCPVIPVINATFSYLVTSCSFFVGYFIDDKCNGTIACNIAGCSKLSIAM